MQYHGADYVANRWDTYWFEKNIQGDIVAVYDAAGTKLIGYFYDAWGNFTTAYYDNAYLTSAVNNPFTYRGYYYDRDLGLYYLNSRYYDANIGRFINEDDIQYLGANGDLNSYNLYAYCSNNPAKSLKVIFLPRNSINSINNAQLVNTPSSNNTTSSKKNENYFRMHWGNEWFDTDWPGFFIFSKDGLEVVSWSLSIYKGSLYLDNEENHSLYVSGGNIGIYAGFNYKKGLGLDASASVAEIGYDGPVVDASLEGLSIGFTYMYKDGKFTLKHGYGWWGWSISIDFVELWNWLF